MTRHRDWTPEQRQRSQARAAYLFLNIAACPDCGLPWAQGYVHPDCPGPLPEEVVTARVEDAADDASFGPLTESENRLMDGNR